VGAFYGWLDDKGVGRLVGAGAGVGVTVSFSAQRHFYNLHCQGTTQRTKDKGQRIKATQAMINIDHNVF